MLDPVAPLPEVLMLPAEGELFTLSLAYVEAARSPNSGIALRPGLQVSSITSDPLWNVDPSDQAIVPATELLNFSVVVGNAGNVASEPEPLELTLTGESDPVVLSGLVPVLEPGEQTAVQFLEIPVTPGALYEVAASPERRDQRRRPRRQRLNRSLRGERRVGRPRRSVPSSAS